MAASAFRAAQIMRRLSLKSQWNHTSRRMISTGTMSNHYSSNDNGLMSSRSFNMENGLMPLLRSQSIRTNMTENKEDPRLLQNTNMKTLDRVVMMFEERCQRVERVNEKDFVKTFDILARTIEKINPSTSDYVGQMSNIIQYSSLLLRCCGKLMFETPPKGRELLAGNLWTFIKEKKIPLDISHYNCLIRVMNENETVFSPEKILEEIQNNGLYPDKVTYQRLIYQYCRQGDVESANKMLQTMKDKGFELNETIFASLLIGYSKQEKPPAVNDILDLMNHSGVEPGSKTYTAALVAQAEQFSKDPERAAQEMKNIIIRLDTDGIPFTTNECIDLINTLGPLAKTHQIVMEFFNQYISHLTGSSETRYRLLATILRANLVDLASRLFWSQKANHRSIQVGNLGIYYIRALARNHNVDNDFAIGECLKLQENEWNVNALKTLFYHAIESGNLKLGRAVMKKFKEEEPMKVIYAWPFIAQAKNHDEVVEVLKEDLSDMKNVADILETFSQWVWPKFSNDVMKLFELNKDLNFDKNLLITSFLNYAVQEKKFDEAIKFIGNISQDLTTDPTSQEETNETDAEEPARSPKVARRSEQNRLVTRLLDEIAEHTKDPEMVWKAFNMCQLPSDHMSSRSLEALVKVYMMNDNFEKALESFQKLSKDYRVTPYGSELMSYCLTNKDPESLQKVMASVAEVHGEINSLYDLALCCLRCDKLKQAQKIFASPGFRVRPIRVYQTCRSIARQNDITLLENFVNLTRDMYDINQEYLYQILINTYERTSNAKRALNLWNMMQEEEFQPSKKSLIMIADLLEKNNIQVPFQKPKMIDYGHAN